MDNDKQDQETILASPGQSDNIDSNDPGYQPQPFQSGETADVANPVSSPFASSSTTKPKKSPVKIIIAISLALILIVGGIVAFFYLGSPRQIIQEALINATRTDQTFKYRITSTPRPSSEKDKYTFLTADDAIVYVKGAMLEGRINWLGQKKQGSVTADIVVAYDDYAAFRGKKVIPLGQKYRGDRIPNIDLSDQNGYMVKLGKFDLTSDSQGKIYFRTGDNLLKNYYRLTDGFIMKDDQIKQRFGSIDSSVKQRHVANLIQYRKELLANIKIMSDRWIKVDPDKLDRNNMCKSRFMADLAQPQAGSELIKVIMKSKLLDITVAGKDKDVTIYQVKLNPDAWADTAKQLANLDSFRSFHKCAYEYKGRIPPKLTDQLKIDSTSAVSKVKKILSLSDPTIKLWVKSSLLSRPQITKYNVKTKPFRLPGDKGAGKLNLTIEQLAEKPKVTSPGKSTTLDQALDQIDEAAQTK
jgi:hypothetical protein